MYKYKQVFAAACIGLLIFGIMLITLGSILPSLTDRFKMDELKAGNLTSILPVGILIGSLFFGPVVDRYGYKLLLILTTLIILASFEGIAFANSFFLLQIAVLVIGFGGGIINGATNSLVADITTGHKGAGLSLLGAFFGFGALGMPLLLGILSKKYEYPVILSAVGFFLLLIIIYFIAIRFPVPKQAKGFPVKEGMKLLKEPAILLIGLFLFFQSGAEALINNWITSFLHKELKVSEQVSLYTLTFYMVGLTVTRLISGIALKKISSFSFMWFSLLLSLVGGFLLIYAGIYSISLIALIIMGIGLAAGFPVMLGYIGQLFTELSGTAFSIVLVIGLIGNITINYLFGIISHRYGIGLLPWLFVISVICRAIILFLIRLKISFRIKM